MAKLLYNKYIEVKSQNQLINYKVVYLLELSNYNGITIVKVPKIEIEKIDFISCNEPKETLEHFYNRQTIKPDVLINGGFFALNNGTPVFDFTDDGQVKSSHDDYSYGIGITSNGDLLFGKDTGIWKDFLTAYPPLLINGNYQTFNIGSEIAYKARRSIIGYNADYIFFIAIDTPGATFKEAAEIAKKVGCLYAINLDGGGSTRLLYNGAGYAKAAVSRQVDNVIALYTKKTKIIYRVQIGAFSNELNAKKLCDKIKNLGNPYSSAYVRFINPYYKVQVGAFSIKENAEKIVKDLKSKGYNAFITI